jgi:hypothetical protein
MRIVINGRHDIMQPTSNSYLMAQHIPKAQLIICPDSGHGALFQYPRLFVDHVARFPDAKAPFAWGNQRVRESLIRLRPPDPFVCPDPFDSADAEIVAS